MYQYHLLGIDPSKIHLNSLHPRNHRGTERRCLRANRKALGMVQLPTGRVLSRAFSQVIGRKGCVSRAQEERVEKRGVRRISLKCSFGWLFQHSTNVVTLVEQEKPSPRPLTDQEEQDLVAAVTTSGSSAQRHGTSGSPRGSPDAEWAQPVSRSLCQDDGTLTERVFEYIVPTDACRASRLAVSPHTLRHRFSSRLAEAVPLHRRAQRIGPDSLKATRISA